MFLGRQPVAVTRRLQPAYVDRRQGVIVQFHGHEFRGRVLRLKLPEFGVTDFDDAEIVRTGQRDLVLGLVGAPAGVARRRAHGEGSWIDQAQLLAGCRHELLRRGRAPRNFGAQQCDVDFLGKTGPGRDPLPVADESGLPDFDIVGMGVEGQRLLRKSPRLTVDKHQRIGWRRVDDEVARFQRERNHQRLLGFRFWRRTAFRAPVARFQQRQLVTASRRKCQFQRCLATVLTIHAHRGVGRLAAHLDQSVSALEHQCRQLLGDARDDPHVLLPRLVTSELHDQQLIPLRYAQAARCHPQDALGQTHLGATRYGRQRYPRPQRLQPDPQ